MNCRRARNLLELYRSGERTPARERALQEHLRHCVSCRREAERIERNAALIKESAAEISFSESEGRIQDQVLHRIRSLDFSEGKPLTRFGHAPSAGSLAWIRYALSGAAVAVILLLSLQTGALMQRVAELESRMSGIASIPAGEHASKESLAGISTILDQIFPEERNEFRKINAVDLLRISAAIKRLDDSERAVLIKLLRSLEKEGIIGGDNTVDVNRLRSRLREWNSMQNRKRFF